MRLFRLILLGAAVSVAACQPQPAQELPTLAVLPSLVPSVEEATVTASPALPATATSTRMPPTARVTATTERVTALPSATPLPSDTPEPSPTQPPVTIEIRQDVRVSTLTPVPPGENAPLRTTPMVMADAVITEQEFQLAVNQAVTGIDSLQLATIDFVPGGIQVELTALGGVAYVAGDVQVLIQMSGSFATITIGDVTVNGGEPSDTYLEVVSGDFFTMLVRVFDEVLTERVGPDHDLENIVLTDTAMEVFLLVPEP